MIESRIDRELLEEQQLAPFALRSSESRGRLHAERHSSRRVAFQRDRDRIEHCKSFRRLEYKTQVFVNGTDDHYRSRLTHTIEMTSIARTLARALRVNEDCASAISLAHDIGHSPFGHSGERALDAIMAEHGGFDHNVQSLRWVEFLEEDYPGFDGLNLSWEVRAGLRKHLSRIPGETLDGYPVGPFQSVEAQIADVADDIAYQAHDAQDGLEAGLIKLDELRALYLWRMAEERVCADYPDAAEDRLISSTVRMIIRMQIEDVLAQASHRIEETTPENVNAVMNARHRTVAFSDGLRTLLQPYRAYLYEEMYFHPIVRQANEQAVEWMTRLFEHYCAHPEDMGSKARRRLDEQGLMRTVCDYVAGCTDRFALEECQRYRLMPRWM